MMGWIDMTESLRRVAGLSLHENEALGHPHRPMPLRIRQNQRYRLLPNEIKSRRLIQYLRWHMDQVIRIVAQGRQQTLPLAGRTHNARLAIDADSPSGIDE